MFPIGISFSLFKRMPRIMALLLNIITIFLTVFLLVGCCSSSYLSIFLIKYQFNDESEFYSTLKENFSYDGMEDITVKVGYLNICLTNLPDQYLNSLSSAQFSNITSDVSINGHTICYPKHNFSETTIYDDFAINLIKSGTSSNSSLSSDVSNTLNILKIANVTSNSIIHPYILIATIVLVCLMFLLIMYVTIPFELPLKTQINKLLLIWSAVLVLVWGFGTIWSHVAIESSRDLIPDSSFNIIKVENGKKTSAMSWCSFVFLLLDCIILWALYIRDRKSMSQEIEEMNNKNNPFNDKYYNKYMSESSTINSNNK
ncbi:hypothetical protein TPHA_0A04120 [Tetrapisispora phaffii CBS 4417]|uniref:Factor-induced gene 1 protein n=1 Tax=Tetrapisispora phaffii (strain ATCC 24235 / CBS 4417 / NBRC 1672 / NRRL Y-8282 / UCD 70-5) TaxID=1071381 RepID=G8BNK9_TETPH|nr:hypothetical protein TPHA_0A04120 [Tetrapisispora phaffii CBS 4417]CCE61487.1 hypothetical protein TPHA_0A04120 [Tetrapisispora phaffii CBS 4417]